MVRSATTADDSVEKHIPQLGSLKTKEGQPVRLTIRHLLTHTSGMAEITGDQAKGVMDLAGLIPLYASQPVAFKPGERWAYCQSSINTAARVVEAASGKRFVDFLMVQRANFPNADASDVRRAFQEKAAAAR